MMTTQLNLTLYVSCHDDRTTVILDGINQVLSDIDGIEYEIEVVNVLEQPERALEEEIIATPTLLRRQPPPKQKLFGTIDDAASIMQLLAWDAAPGSSPPNPEFGR